jgi:hypothetical protein
MRQYSLLLIGALSVGLTMPALAAETWIQCDGTVVTKNKKEEKSAPATDWYVYDDANQTFYKYSPQRKTLDPYVSVNYSPKQITWGTPNTVGQQLTFEGKLDRGPMALSISRREYDETMTWKQTCKPSAAQTLGN